MPVYKRRLKRGERWWFKFDYNGKTFSSKAIFLSRNDAKKAESDKLSEVAEQVSAPGNMTLFDLCQRRLDEIKLVRSNFYYKENRRHFKKVLDFFVKGRDVGSITRMEINDFLTMEAKRLKSRKKTNHKLNSMIRCIKALFNYGIRTCDLELKNPVSFVKPYPIEIKLKHIPTDAEISKVREGLNEKQLFLFDFVDQTGCRIMEAVRFKAEDIDGELITLWTRKSKNSNLTPRRIPKPDCLKDYKGKGRVFKEWTEYPRFIDGNKWSWHNLRHRRASLWANSGMTTFEIMKRLGHSNLQTTMGYLQLLGFTRL
jgi:integrase